MNCKNCKHWKKAQQYETGHSLGLGSCENVPMFWESTEWSPEGRTRQFKEEDKDKRAFVQDGSDYVAVLLTLPDFGCTGFTPSDT